jgi:hypothetical protein
MIRIIYLALLTIFCFIGSVEAQIPANLYPDSTYNKTVILKNGATYHYIKILRVIEGEKYIIERADSKIIQIPFDKVYGVTDEDNYSEMLERLRIKRQQSIDPFAGAVNTVQLGLSYIDGEPYEAISDIIGYRFSHRWSLGFGITIDGLSKVGPISAILDAKWYTNYRKINGFIYSQFGVSSPMFKYSDDQEKLRIDFGGGIDFQTHTRLSFSILAGYRMYYHKNQDFLYCPEILMGLTF